MINGVEHCSSFITPTIFVGIKAYKRPPEKIQPDRDSRNWKTGTVKRKV